MLLHIFSDWTILYEWVILPLIIFCARICDQTVGTLRLIFIAKGNRKLAPIMGFVETLIWIVVIAQIIAKVTNPLCYIAYAAGFATGNYVGILVEERLSLGNVIVRVITPNLDLPLSTVLTEHHFSFTVLDAEGSSGKVKVIFVVLDRVDLKQFIAMLNEKSPSAFYTVEDVKQVKEGIYPNFPSKSIFLRSILQRK
ncbi:UPF0316 protein [Bacteroidia bacterium]|nr:UPF0316 protein [Bacteroidia bacterium]